MAREGPTYLAVIMARERPTYLTVIMPRERPPYLHIVMVREASSPAYYNGYIGAFFTCPLKC
jgi:hypothetical protein